MPYQTIMLGSSNYRTFREIKENSKQQKLTHLMEWQISLEIFEQKSTHILGTQHIKQLLMCESSRLPGPLSRPCLECA